MRFPYLAGPLLVALAVCCVFSPPASASWPGRDGAIVFVAKTRGYYPEGNAPGLGIWSRRLGSHSQLRRLTADPSDRSPAVSPNGWLVAFSRAVGPLSGNAERRAIYLMRIDGSSLRRVTEPVAEDMDPAFAPSGRRLLFARSPLGGTRGDDIYSIRSDGSGLHRITSGGATDAAPAFSPNRRVVAFERGTFQHILTMRPNGSRSQDATPYVPSGVRLVDPEFSPTGRQVAFSRIGDRGRIFSMRPDGRHWRRLSRSERSSCPSSVHCETHVSPVFAPSGRTLLFVGVNSYRSRFHLVLLHRGNRVHPMSLRFAGDRDVDEPAWQPLPRRP